jgi:hypothetical protein
MLRFRLSNHYRRQAALRTSRLSAVGFALIAVAAVFGGRAIAAQDKYALQVPDGIAFSDFRGYEGWSVVSISQTGELLKVIVANPTMINAYLSGIPGNGKPFPDGSKIAKIEWEPKKSSDAPFDVNVPDKLHDVNFIEKDSMRFPKSGGWGYALFKYNAASDAYSPVGSGSGCGAECHTRVKANDFIFHPYQKR